MEQTQRLGHTRSVERAANILLALANGHVELGLTELSRTLDLGKGTVHRLLQTLVATGLVSHVPESHKYRLGAQALQIGLSVLESLPIRQESRPFLMALRTETSETAFLSIIVGTYYHVPIEQAITHLEPRRVAPIGMRLPLRQNAVGKVLLAFSGEAFIRQYLEHTKLEALTDRTITDLGEFLRELATVRSQGYALSIGEATPKANALALALTNARGDVLGAIQIAGPSERWTEEKIRRHTPACTAIIEPLRDRLRYVEPTRL